MHARRRRLDISCMRVWEFNTKSQQSGSELNDILRAKYLLLLLRIRPLLNGAVKRRNVSEVGEEGEGVKGLRAADSMLREVLPPFKRIIDFEQCL